MITGKTGQVGAPAPRRRAVVALVVVVMLCLLFRTSGGRTALLALWGAANVGLGCAAVSWGLFHPRSVLPGRDVALRWALWLSVPAVFAAYLAADTGVADQFGVSIPSAIVLLALLVSLPILLLAVFAAGLFGAALAAFWWRGHVRSGQAALDGARVWWLAIALLAALGTVTQWELREVAVWFAVGLPVLTVAGVSLMRRTGFTPERLFRRVMRLLSHRLVWRIGAGQSGRRIDARGAALGMVAAAAILLVDRTQLLASLQARSLVAMIQFRNALGPADPPVRRAEASPDRVVLVVMDAETRRRALSDRSEAAVQADAIRTLRRYGSGPILLPMPVLTFPPRPPKPPDEPDEPRMDPIMAIWQPDLDVPLPSPADAERSHRDLPLLIREVRAAGRVVIEEPTTQRPPMPGEPETEASTAIGQLRRAAAASGSGDFGAFGAARVPVVPIDRDGRPTVPFRLLTLLRGGSAGGKARADTVLAGGRAIPAVAPGRVLIDFRGRTPGHTFRQITYGQLLSGETGLALPSRAGPDERPRRWVTPTDLLRNRIVLLDSVERHERDTPIGMMPHQEVLANAVMTLLAGGAPAPWPLPYRVLCVLASGIAAGAICTRRPPALAGWRAGVLAFAIATGTGLAFAFRGLWIDPTTALLAVFGAFLMTTQMTFALERAERDRHRDILQRFVAPEVVDELLEDWENLGLGGTRQQVCVLFADVRNFTPFAERHTPEEVIEIINTYMTAMTDRLYAYGGMLTKYTGDGLMALFRVSGDPERAVERAVCAALVMRDAANEVTARYAGAGIESLQVGIGLHVGEAVVGLVGNPNRFDYTALGHTVNVTARLQGIAAGGEVVVSEPVCSVIGGALHTEAGEPVFVKGVSEPVVPYRVLAIDVSPAESTA